MPLLSGAALFSALRPVLSQQFNVGRRQPGGDINLAVADPAIDLQLRDRPVIDENIKPSAAPIDTQRIECEPAVLVQKKQGAVGSIRGAIRLKAGDVVL